MLSGREFQTDRRPASLHTESPSAMKAESVTLSLTFDLQRDVGVANYVWLKHLQPFYRATRMHTA